MKKITAVFILFLIYYEVLAQCPQYKNLMSQGEAFMKAKKFKEALNKFNSAKLCNPSMGSEVDKKINDLFEVIEKEKDEAVKQKNLVEISKNELESSKKSIEFINEKLKLTNDTLEIQKKTAQQLASFAVSKSEEAKENEAIALQQKEEISNLYHSSVATAINPISAVNWFNGLKNEGKENSINNENLVNFFNKINSHQFKEKYRIGNKNYCDFSSNHEYILVKNVNSDKQLLLVEFKTGNIQQINTQNKEFDKATFTNDSKWIIIASKNSIFIYDIYLKSEFKAFQSTDTISHYLLSPNKKHLLVTTNNVDFSDFSLIDINKNIIHQFEGDFFENKKASLKCEFSSDSQFIVFALNSATSSRDPKYSYYIFDLFKYKVPSLNSIIAYSFNKNGNYVVIKNEKSIEVIELNTQIKFQYKRFENAKFSENQKFVILYNLRKRNNILINLSKGTTISKYIKSKSVISPVFSNDSRFLLTVANVGNTMDDNCLWDLENEKLLRIKGNFYYTDSIFSSFDKKLLVFMHYDYSYLGLKGGGGTVYDLEKKEIVNIRETNLNFRFAQVTKDGRFLIYKDWNNNILKITDLKIKKTPNFFEITENPYYTDANKNIFYSLGDNLVITSSKNIIKIWDCKIPNIRYSQETFNQKINLIEFNFDKTLYSLQFDNDYVKLFNIKNHKSIFNDGFKSIKFAPLGYKILLENDNSYTPENVAEHFLFDYKKMRFLHSFNAENNLRNPFFSPDGKKILLNYNESGTFGTAFHSNSIFFKWRKTNKLLTDLQNVEAYPNYKIFTSNSRYYIAQTNFQDPNYKLLFDTKKIFFRWVNFKFPNRTNMVDDFENYILFDEYDYSKRKLTFFDTNKKKVDSTLTKLDIYQYCFDKKNKYLIYIKNGDLENKTLHIYSLNSRKIIGTIQCSETVERIDVYNDLIFTKSNKDNYDSNIYDLNTKKEVIFNSEKLSNTSYKIIKKNNQLLTRTNYELKLYDLKEKRLLQNFGNFYMPMVSKDEKYLIFNNSFKFSFWDLEKNELAFDISFSNPINNFEYIPNNGSGIFTTNYTVIKVFLPQNGSHFIWIDDEKQDILNAESVWDWININKKMILWPPKNNTLDGSEELKF